jgi:hypothetical protein
MLGRILSLTAKFIEFMAIPIYKRVVNPTDELKFNKKGLPSFFSNLIINRSNPADDNEPGMLVDDHYSRDLSKYFINVIWKSIFTGIKQTVGIN